MTSLMRLRSLGNAAIYLRGSRSRISRIHSNFLNRTFASAQLTSTRPATEEESVGPQHISKSPSNLVKDGEVKEQEQKRLRVSQVKISEVLKAKHSLRWVDSSICKDAMVKDAITVCIDGGLSGMMVIDRTDNRKVVGLVTSRDLLRIVASGLKERQTPSQVMNQVVSDFMTPISQVIYGKPEETIGMCRSIMAKLGIKCLPILSKEGNVSGLVTSKDMNSYGLEAKDRGGKKSFLKDVSGRVGLSSNTSMAEPPRFLQAHLALDQQPLFANVGISEIPHPFKTHDGCGINRRDYGPDDLATDPDLSEDAHFFTTVTLPNETGTGSRECMYLGIADGVGSWREYGVDPREFSHKLMEECSNIVKEAADNNLIRNNDNEKFYRTITPAEIIGQAHERVKAHNIIGSSTACVALFDNERHQLHFSNLGDSGIIVLRHIDSGVAGALKRNRQTPREHRTSDLRVAFVSQQQLLAFNHPFQVGWTGEDIEPGESSFKSAKESCTTSLHLRRGDIVIMATDGLFDNVEVDDIATLALGWEQRHGFIQGGDIVAREKRWAMGNSLSVLSAEFVSELSDKMCKKARENSVDSAMDSPFAILAKENDIMWSGGMPDDCTVVAIHVVGRSAEDIMDPVGL